MGGANVKAVYGLWGDLPDGALRLLAYMAVIALDEDDPPRFFGGRETMAYGMGWVVADKTTTDPVELGKRERAFKSVHRLVSILKKAGAITTLVDAAPGRTAEYSLNLKVNRSLKSWDRSRPRSQKNGDHPEADEVPDPAPADGNGPNSFDGTVPNHSTEWSQFSRQTVPSKWGPYEEEDQERTSDEEMADLSTTSHPPHASAPTDRCSDHLLRIKPRTDDLNPCPLCRAGAPPSSDELATVTPINSRRAS